MSWARVVVARLSGLFERRRRERQLSDEIRLHLEMQIEDNIAAGMTSEQARYAALRSFGGIEPMKEAYRERSEFDVLDTSVRDIRYALRTLVKSPAYTATSVATLAIAIGAGTAMFSVIHAVLLRPLPYPSPDQLAMLWTDAPGAELREGRPAYWNVEFWRRESRSFEDLAVADAVSVTRTGAGEPERIGVARVSPNFFSLLGVQAAYGRLLTSEDGDQRQGVVVISHPLWQTYYGGSPQAIGSSLELNGRRSQIVGILPASFQFAPLSAGVWEPHSAFPDWEARRASRGAGSWLVLGRLRPNVSFQQAQSEMSAISRRLDAHMPPADRNRNIRVVPLSVQIVGPRSRLAVWMLTAAIGCVLLIAAANVASLSLARSVSRAREIAVRTMLGASPTRILRQLLTESITLAGISGITGSLLAFACIRFMQAYRPVNLARLDEVDIDLTVLACALVITLLFGIFIGFAPAITALRRNLRTAAEQGGRSVSGGGAGRTMRRALVVAEFALAMILVFGAGVLIRSWRHAESVDPGFRAEGVLSMQLRAPASMRASQRASFYKDVLEQIRTVPAVENAGLLSELFITGNSEQVLTAEGTGSGRLVFRSDEATPGLFAALGTRICRGRDFTADDGPTSIRVAIVNEAMAKRLWAENDPIGKRFRVGAGDWFSVVGVVADMRREGPEREPMPQMFEAVSQNPPGAGYLLVRTSLDDPTPIAGAVRAAVRRVEQHAPLYSITSLESSAGAYLAPRRVQTSIVAGFSVLALLLAAVGIYGLIQYSVAARKHEIGIRIAIGAQRRDIFAMILREGLRLSLTGLALGLAGALWAGRLSSTLLFGVTATDPVTLLSVSALLIAVAGAACFFPAVRAMRIEPTQALRMD